MSPSAFFESISFSWYYILALPVVSLFYYYVCPALREEAAFRVYRQRYGCEKCRVHPDSNGVFHSKLAERRRQAMKSGRLTFSYTPDFQRLGKTWEERLPHKRTINTIELPNVQYVYQEGFNNFPKAAVNGRIGEEFLGQGILISQGAQWKRSREMTAPLFARANVANVSVVGKHVDRLMDVIPKNGQAFDIQPLLKNFFTDFSSEILFGESFNSQFPEQVPGLQKFLTAFDEAVRGWAKRRDAGNWLFMHAFDSKWKQACATVHEFIDVYVERALEAVEKEPREMSAVAEKGGEYDRFILLHEMAKQIKDPVELRFQILNIFLPTRDSIAILLSNVFFQLARCPEKWIELHEYALTLGDTPLTYEKLKSLLPFRYVLQETLRHIGPLGRVTRTARTDCVLPVGGGPDGKSPLFVPKGVSVCFSTRQLHHDRDYWGEDADEFRPERWAAKKPTWEFLGFSTGPRACPGQQSVYIHATYLLVRMAKEFKSIENKDPEYEWRERATSAVLESWNGAKIALTRK